MNPFDLKLDPFGSVLAFVVDIVGRPDRNVNPFGSDLDLELLCGFETIGKAARFGDGFGGSLGVEPCQNRI